MKFEKWEEVVASKTCQRAFERAVTVTGAAVTYCFSVSALLSAAFSVCSATSSLDTRQALGVTTRFEQNCTLRRDASDHPLSVRVSDTACL